MIRQLLSISFPALLLMSGCMTSPTGEVSHWPTTALFAEYSGSDGSALQVETLGFKIVRNAQGFAEASFPLRFSYRAPLSSEWLPLMVEHISMDGGRIIRQDMLCDPAGQNPDEIECERDRIRVNFAAAGLPAALGMGPVWERGAPKSGSTEVFQTPVAGRLNVTWSVSRDGECTSVTGSRDHRIDLLADWFPPTVLDSQFTYCDEALPQEFQSSQIYPVSFSAVDRPLYIMAKYTQLAPLPTSAPTRDGYCLPPEPDVPGPEGPLLATDGHPDFSARQAYHVAMERHEMFADHANDPGVTLVKASYTSGAQVNSLLSGNTSTDIWQLTVQRHPADRVTVDVSRSVTRNLLTDEQTTTYNVEDGDVRYPQTLPQDPPDLDSQRATGTAAYAWHAALLDTKVVVAGYSFSFGRGAYGSVGQGATHAALVSAMSEPPDLDPSAVIYAPLWISAETRTGGLLELQLTPTLAERFDKSQTCPPIG